jgi:hypothetical protein
MTARTSEGRLGALLEHIERAEARDTRGAGGGPAVDLHQRAPVPPGDSCGTPHVGTGQLPLSSEAYSFTYPTEAGDR